MMMMAENTREIILSALMHNFLCLLKENMAEPKKRALEKFPPILQIFIRIGPAASGTQHAGSAKIIDVYSQ